MNNDQGNGKKTKLSFAGEVLQALFENGKSPLSVQFLRWKLWKKWGEFVGPTIAAVSEPASYQHGVLYVWVKNASWMQQLVFMRDPMKESINQKLGMAYVRDIRLTLDRKYLPTDAQTEEDLKKSIDQIMSGSSDND